MAVKHIQASLIDISGDEPTKSSQDYDRGLESAVGRWHLGLRTQKTFASLQNNNIWGYLQFARKNGT